MHFLASLYQLDSLLNLLGTVPGIFLAAMMLVMFLLTFGRNGRWIVMCVLMFCSTFSFNNEALRNALIPPLQQIRFAAEPLTLLFMVFLIIPSFLVRSASLRTPMLAAAVIFWILEMLYSVRLATNIEASHGLLSMVIFCTILVTIGFGMPRWFRGIDDVHIAARCIGCVALLFLVSTSAQLVVNRGAIVSANRLYAITGNPQHAAFMLAIFLVPVCLLLGSSRETKPMRIVWGAATGLIIVMLIWTGSRTGALTSLVGVGMLFRRRIGGLFGGAIIAAIFVFFFLSLFKLEPSADSHLLSTADTRTDVWRRQIEYFKANPIFGEMSLNDRGGGENSYLTIAAHLGVVGLFTLGGVILFIVTASLRLRSLRELMKTNDDRLLVDWIPASLTAIFVGAFFEAVLVGTLTFMLLSVYFFLGVLKFLSDKNTLVLAAAEQGTQHQLFDEQPAADSRLIYYPAPSAL